MADEPDDVISCRDLARGLAAQHYEFDVYALNITIILIDEENEHRSACLDTIRSDLVPLYLEYLRSEVEACDFKPDPGIFLYGGESESDIERVKLEMRPRYVSLVTFAKNRLTRRKFIP